MVSQGHPWFLLVSSLRDFFDCEVYFLHDNYFKEVFLQIVQTLPSPVGGVYLPSPLLLLFTLLSSSSFTPPFSSPFLPSPSFPSLRPPLLSSSSPFSSPLLSRPLSFSPLPFRPYHLKRTEPSVLLSYFATSFSIGQPLRCITRYYSRQVTEVSNMSTFYGHSRFLQID